MAFLTPHVLAFAPKIDTWRHHCHVPWDTTTSENRMCKATDHTANGLKDTRAIPPTPGDPRRSLRPAPERWGKRLTISSVGRPGVACLWCGLTASGGGGGAAADGPGRHLDDPASVLRCAARGDLGVWRTGGLRRARQRRLCPARRRSASGTDRLPTAELSSPQRLARMCARYHGRGRLPEALHAIRPSFSSGTRLAAPWLLPLGR